MTLLLASPRHRRFYLGAGPAGRPAAGPSIGAGQPTDRPAGARRRPSTAESPRDRGAGNSESPGEPSLNQSQRGAALHPGPDGSLRIPVADQLPETFPADAVPEGWALKAVTGRAVTDVVQDDGHVGLRLRSDRSSFLLYRDLVVDLKQLPIFRWSWKATVLPENGDGRARGTDDQAIQIYIVIPRWPSPRANSEVIGYVWDTRAPVGERIVRTDSPNVRSIVVESGAARRGRWIREERNVYRDFVELFGREPARAGFIALMTDSNDTQGSTEALVDELVFLKASTGNAGFSRRYAKMPVVLRGDHEP